MLIMGIMTILTCYWPWLLLMGILGFLLHWLLSRLFGKGHSGDLTANGEGELRALAVMMTHMHLSGVTAILQRV